MGGEEGIFTTKILWPDLRSVRPELYIKYTAANSNSEHFYYSNRVVYAVNKPYELPSKKYMSDPQNL